MLAEKHRRLWRRRVRRRPLLPFLLAATLTIDLVLLQLQPESPYVAGWILGQISLLSAWVTSSPRHLMTRACLTLVAVLLGLHLCGTLAHPGMSPQEIQIGAVMVSIDLRAITTTVVLASLATTVTASGLLQLIYRSRETGLRTALRPRLSLGFLMSLTTLVAVAIGFGRLTDWNLLTVSLVAGLILLEGVVVAAVLSIWLAIADFGWRLVFLVVAPVTTLIAIAAADGPRVATYYATHAALLGGWLMAIDSRRWAHSAAGR